MERFIKVVVIGLFFQCMCFLLMGQNPVDKTLLHFPLWFLVDDNPEFTQDERRDNNFSHYGDEGVKKGYGLALAQIKKIAPFFIEALVYGWEFSYTPSDKMRNVEEYFEITPLYTFDFSKEVILYSMPFLHAQDNVFECQVEYKLTQHMIAWRKMWDSIYFLSVQGRGEGSIFIGTEGIKEASKNALKAAVRNYARKIIKNKPKEIRGRVLLKKYPHYYINAGNYVADLDFFLYVSKIVEYKQF